MFADGICRNRNICWLPINNNPWWKFKSKARVSYLGIPRKQIAYVCPNQGTGGYAFASIENSCAWQKVKNNFGAWTFNGSVHKNKRICARGKQYSDLYNKLYLDKYETITESDGMEESSIEVSESIFNQNNITNKMLRENCLFQTLNYSALLS